MTELIIRTGGSSIDLCEHISINGEIVDEYEGEYHECINIYCKNCKRTHYITIAVN